MWLHTTFSAHYYDASLRMLGVSNSKLDPRATCADEYDRCSTVNSISFRRLEEVWFEVVALLAAYGGLDREAEQWARPSSFPYSACPMQWMVCVWYKRLALACGVTRKYKTVRGFTAKSVIGLRALACGDQLHDLNHC